MKKFICDNIEEILIGMAAVIIAIMFYADSTKIESGYCADKYYVEEANRINNEISETVEELYKEIDIVYDEETKTNIYYINGEVFDSEYVG